MLQQAVKKFKISAPGGHFNQVREKMKNVNVRLAIALSLYAILALAALFALDGFLRTFVVLLIAFFAVKSVVHVKKGDVD
jgi:hypothetical protein